MWRRCRGVARLVPIKCVCVRLGFNICRKYKIQVFPPYESIIFGTLLSLSLTLSLPLLTTSRMCVNKMHMTNTAPVSCACGETNYLTGRYLSKKSVLSLIEINPGKIRLVSSKMKLQLGLSVTRRINCGLNICNCVFGEKKGRNLKVGLLFIVSHTHII